MELLPGDPLMSRDNLDSMQIDNVASGTRPGLARLGIRPAAVEAIAPLYLAPRSGPGAPRHLARRRPSALNPRSPPCRDGPR